MHVPHKVVAGQEGLGQDVELHVILAAELLQAAAAAAVVAVAGSAAEGEGFHLPGAFVELLVLP